MVKESRVAGGARQVPGGKTTRKNLDLMLLARGGSHGFAAKDALGFVGNMQSENRACDTNGGGAAAKPGTWW